jgi:hypothetical protein
MYIFLNFTIYVYINVQALYIYIHIYFSLPLQVELAPVTVNALHIDTFSGIHDDNSLTNVILAQARLCSSLLEITRLLLSLFLSVLLTNDAGTSNREETHSHNRGEAQGHNRGEAYGHNRGEAHGHNRGEAQGLGRRTARYVRGDRRQRRQRRFEAAQEALKSPFARKGAQCSRRGGSSVCHPPLAWVKNGFSAPAPFSPKCGGFVFITFWVHF